jgi:ABC-type antimicrobial peptide transport system permease subunit
LSAWSLRAGRHRAITGINPQISLTFDTITSQVQRALLPERLMATLSGYFGVLAGLIAAIGLYGVMSYLVARRRNEIGIRMAWARTGRRW